MVVNSGAGPDGSPPAGLRAFMALLPPQPPPPESACRPEVAEASALLLPSQPTASSRKPCSIMQKVCFTFSYGTCDRVYGSLVSR